MAVENYISPSMVLINSVLAHANLGIFHWLVSPFFWPRPDLLTGIALKVSTLGGRDFGFPKNRQEKKFSVEAYPLLHTNIPCFLSLIEKYPLWLDFMVHCGVTFLGVFPCFFFDYTNILFPLQHTILQPITFGIVIPCKTANIIRTSANLKPVTQTKQFSGFDIIWVHGQNAFGGLGLIPTTRAKLFLRIKI